MGRDTIDKIRHLTGTQRISEEDQERALNRLQNGQTMNIALKLPRQVSRDTSRGFLGIKRAVQGGKKAQYGNAAGRLATAASIAAGRDTSQIPDLAARYNGTVRGAMALANNITKKDSKMKRIWNRIRGKEDRSIKSNLMNLNTYIDAYNEFGKGYNRGKAKAKAQVKKISNDGLGI